MFLLPRDVTICLNEFLIKVQYHLAPPPVVCHGTQQDAACSLQLAAASRSRSRSFLVCFCFFVSRSPSLQRRGPAGRRLQHPTCSSWTLDEAGRPPDQASACNSMRENTHTHTHTPKRKRVERGIGKRPAGRLAATAESGHRLCGSTASAVID